MPLTTFMPRVDKESGQPFLPESPLEMARNDQMPSYPYLTGIASQEGAYITAAFFGNYDFEFLVY
jgi:hypothetical protein